MKTPQKLFFALCFSFGVAAPLAALAQMTPTKPGASDLTPPMSMPSSGAATDAPGVITAPAPTTAPATTPTPPVGGAEPSGTMKPESAMPGSSAPMTKPAAKSNMTKPMAMKVNINKASMTELIKVKGIGPATAKKIVAGRPFLKLDDLVTKKIMAPKQYDAVKSQLMVP